MVDNQSQNPECPFCVPPELFVQMTKYDCDSSENKALIILFNSFIYVKTQ